MICAIVFDCFGVLTSDGWLPFKKQYFGPDPRLEQQATDLNKQVDAGLADYQGFLQQVADLADISYEKARQAIENNVADETLFNYIRDTLKPSYKIGLLSNAGANWLDDLFSSEQVHLFDATALSFETGHIKPQPQAYAAIADRLGVEPEQCVFIDDQERYCTAARQQGMQAIVYRDFDQMRSELESILAQNRQ